jgi:hypothetical protein
LSNDVFEKQFGLIENSVPAANCSVSTKHLFATNVIRRLFTAFGISSVGVSSRGGCEDVEKSIFVVVNIYFLKGERV